MSIVKYLKTSHIMLLYYNLIVLLLVAKVLCLPSARRCSLLKNDTSVAAICDYNRKYEITYMPPNEAIYFAENKTLQKPTSKIPAPYFPLSMFDPHRDGRFYKDISIPARNRHLMLVRIYKEFVVFARERGLKYWLVHGGLIGWYWNEQLLPWDMDLDIMVLHYDLEQYYSKYHEFVYNDRYLFEVNPNSYYREKQLTDTIDARFIDKTNGLYVDITAVTYDATKKQLHCKSPHYYDVDDIFPLRNGTFVDMETWIPHNPESMMLKEYGPKSLYSNTFKRGKRLFEQKYGEIPYIFDEVKNVWVKDKHGTPCGDCPTLFGH